jgi:hypothetical protein
MKATLIGRNQERKARPWCNSWRAGTYLRDFSAIGQWCLGFLTAKGSRFDIRRLKPLYSATLRSESVIRGV